MFKLVIRRALLACALVTPFVLIVTAPARAVVFTGYTNCGPADGVAIRGALAAAANPATQSQAYVAGLPGTGPALFQTWFGRVAASATVANVYSHVDGLIGSHANMEVFCGVGMNVGGHVFTPCAAHEIAASMYQVMALQVCGPFFARNTIGLDSRAGTIIHEFTHITDNTEDHAYGCQNARNGALAPPYQRYNADNYEYMSEVGFMGAICP